MTLGERFDVVLAAARTGAEWAWAEIYQDLSPPVHTYLRARGAAEPEELVGEVSCRWSGASTVSRVERLLSVHSCCLSLIGGS